MKRKIKKATQICDEGVQTDSRPDGETKKRVSKSKPISFTQKDKIKFRASKEWKEFRIAKIAETNGLCELCGRAFPSPKLHIHHRNLDRDHYTDISDKSKFKVLCVTCHDFLHSVHSMVISMKNCTTNQKLIELQKPFFITH